PPALPADVTVEVIDLRPPSAEHVLQQRRSPAAEMARARRYVPLHVGEAAPLHRLDEPLGRDAVDRLDLVTRRPADLDDLGGDVDRDAARERLAPHLRRPEPAEPGERVRHAVHGELRPALAPEVRRHLRGGDVAQDARELARPRRVLTVQLADLEADLPRVRARRMTRLVHARPDRDHTAERPPPPRDRRDPLVADPALAVHHDTVRPHMPY